MLETGAQRLLIFLDIEACKLQFLEVSQPPQFMNAGTLTFAFAVWGDAMSATGSLFDFKRHGHYTFVPATISNPASQQPPAKSRDEPLMPGGPTGGSLRIDESLWFSLQHVAVIRRRRAVNVGQSLYIKRYTLIFFLEVNILKYSMYIL